MSSGTSTAVPQKNAPTTHDELRRAYSFVPTSVSAVCGHDGDTPRGLVVATLQPVSLEPPLLGILIQTSSTTWPILAGLGRFGISVLAEHQTGYAQLLASQATNRFAGVSTQQDESAVYISDAAAWFEVELAGTLPAGDHELALLKVVSSQIDEQNEPLVFHRSRFRSMKPLRDSSAFWPLDDVWQ